MCFKTDTLNVVSKLTHSTLNRLSMEFDAASITGKKKSSLVRFSNSYSAELDGTATDECVIFYLSITLIAFYHPRLAVKYYTAKTV